MKLHPPTGSPRARAVMRRPLRAVSALAATALAAGALVACGSGGGEAGSDEPFVIGAVNSLSGDYSAVGKNIERGIEIAIDEINADGGIMGREVTLESIDDAGDAGKTQLAVKRLVEQDEVDFLLPNPISALRQVTLPYETQNQVLTIAASSSPALADAASYPYSFLNGELNTARSDAMAQLIQDQGGSEKVGLLYTNTSAQIEESERFQEISDGFGLEVTRATEFEGGATDLTSDLAGLRDSGAEVVVAAAQYGSFVNSLMRGMQTLGWDAPVYIFPEGVTGDVHEQVPEAVADQFHALYEAPIIKTEDPDPAMQSFIEKASAESEIDYLMATAVAYDGVWLAKWIFETAQEEHGDTEADTLAQVAQSIGEVEDFPYPQLVFKPNPGWDDDTHTTENYDYSEFYGVIGSSPVENGQYPGELFTTEYAD